MNNQNIDKLFINKDTFLKAIEILKDIAQTLNHKSSVLFDTIAVMEHYAGRDIPRYGPYDAQHDLSTMCQPDEDK